LLDFGGEVRSPPLADSRRVLHPKRMRFFQNVSHALAEKSLKTRRFIVEGM